MFGNEIPADVPRAQSFSEGDRAIDPDGREWRIIHSHEKTTFGSMIRLKSIDGQSEEIGLPDSGMDDWTIEADPSRGWYCPNCGARGGDRLDRCPDCDTSVSQRGGR